MYILEKTMEKIKKHIKETVSELIEQKKLVCGEIPEFDIEIPSDDCHGELSSNVALLSARIFKTSPLKIAQMIVDSFKSDVCRECYIEKAEVAGPGFINFFLSQNFFPDSLLEIKKCAENYGANNCGKNKKVMIEFVSANPTGPMHMGNARLGALGDCLAEVMKKSGYDVYKEFYVNDAGNQIDKFAMSLDVRYTQICQGEDFISMPEDAYHGDDIKQLADEFFEINSNKYINADEKTRRQALVDFALPKNINRMKQDMEKYKIVYDNWFYESKLYKSGLVTKIIKLMKNKNLTYEKDGCLWYKATDFGSEKDEVLVRKNGIPTYFAADIAYHYNKFVVRKFETCIDIWGADHHGHVSRMKGAMEALGINKENLKVILVQLVRLIKNAEVVRMSKRTGKAVQISDLLEEVGTDSARFIFNNHEAGSGMDFDMDLAVAQDSKNPVYYVQYAYARICSIFKQTELENFSNISDVSAFNHPAEKKLIYFMALYPGELARSAKLMDPTKITKYVINLATLFHKFYSSCKVICEDEYLSKSRLFLCHCVRIIIKNVLDIMKVKSPESME